MLENWLQRLKSSQLLTKSLHAIVLALLLCGSAWPQASSTQPQPSTSPNTQQVPEAGVTVQDQQQADTPSAGQQPESKTRITKAQAKELFRSVDEILAFASQDTGLPIQHKVKRNLITSEAGRYVEKRMKDDKDTQRLEQSRLVLEKFGLLPPGYDLHSEFLRLLGEQVAAYYDPKSKSVNLLDWVQPEIQKPVLARGQPTRCKTRRSIWRNGSWPAPKTARHYRISRKKLSRKRRPRASA